jgi:hypothetical protein
MLTGALGVLVEFLRAANLQHGGRDLAGTELDVHPIVEEPVSTKLSCLSIYLGPNGVLSAIFCYC